MARQSGTLRPSVRQAAIVEVIEKNGRASVEKLAEEFDASQETVRRDLNALAEAGRVRKIHGGVVKVDVAREGSFNERINKNLRAKQEVAEKVAKLVQPAQSVMIDTGTATLICSDALSRIHDLTVVTNSSSIAKRISAAQNGSVVILLGGNYRHDSTQTVGPQTCAEIGRFRTDHVILTISALDHLGAYDFAEEEAQVARAMIETANDLTLVADRSKLGHSSTFKICELEKVTRLVLEAKPDPGLHASLMAAGVEVL
jgi:DeoR family glycerol-3-phosphate regulon repressor